MAHRLIGVEDLGGPILESLGVVPDPAAAIAGFGVDVATVLDVPWTAAAVPAMIEATPGWRRPPGQRLLVHGAGGVPAGRDRGGRCQLDQVLTCTSQRSAVSSSASTERSPLRRRR